MDVNVTLRKRQQSCNSTYTLPVSIDLKQKIDEVKNSHNIDFNHAARQVLETLIEKIRTGQLTAE